MTHSKKIKSSRSQVPPGLKRQVEEALRTGAPLPPGVVALGPGQSPPAGAAAMPGVQMPGQEHPSMVAKRNLNPLPDGTDGLKVLRENSECPIPAESKRLNACMSVLVEAEEDEAIERALAGGLMTALRANKHCAKHQSTRPVLTFDKHPEIQTVHEEYLAAEKEALDLQKQLMAAIEKGKELVQKRWDAAVKVGGLSPENHFYSINDQEGSVSLVELNCHECVGAKRITDARETLEALATKVAETNEEKPNDPS